MTCMPITRSGRSTLAAIRVIGIEEVFVARIASGRSARARSWNTFFFTDSLSVTASTANSACAASCAAEAPRSREAAACASSALSFPLPTARSSCPRIPASALPAELRVRRDLLGEEGVELALAALGGTLAAGKVRREQTAKRLRELADRASLPDGGDDKSLRLARVAAEVSETLEVGSKIAPV